MRILGIDPGTRIVGYGVIESRGNTLSAVASGVIRAGAKDMLSRRLLHINDSIAEIIKRCAPHIIAVEEIFYGRNVSTLIKIGEARGVILAAAAAAGVETVGYPPAEVKKAVTGNGKATKNQVREMVSTLLGREVPLESFDESDALALAICHANRARFHSQESIL